MTDDRNDDELNKKTTNSCGFFASLSPKHALKIVDWAFQTSIGKTESAISNSPTARSRAHRRRDGMHLAKNNLAFPLPFA